jgi:hypothetical protein
VSFGKNHASGIRLLRPQPVPETFAGSVPTTPDKLEHEIHAERRLPTPAERFLQGPRCHFAVMESRKQASSGFLSLQRPEFPPPGVSRCTGLAKPQLIEVEPT